MIEGSQAGKQTNQQIDFLRNDAKRQRQIRWLNREDDVEVEE